MNQYTDDVTDDVTQYPQLNEDRVQTQKGDEWGRNIVPKRTESAFENYFCSIKLIFLKLILNFVH